MPEDHPKGGLSAATRGKVTETHSNLSKVFDRKKQQSDIELIRMLKV